MTTEVVAALISENGSILICRRPAGKAQALLWEFPGGKVDPGETPEQALVRECREELAVRLEVGALYTRVTHQYPDLRVRLSLYHAAIAEGRPKNLEHADIRWVKPTELDQYDFCPADRDIIKGLKANALRREPD